MSHCTARSVKRIHRSWPGRNGRRCHHPLSTEGATVILEPLIDLLNRQSWKVERFLTACTPDTGIFQFSVQLDRSDRRGQPLRRRHQRLVLPAWLAQLQRLVELSSDTPVGRPVLTLVSQLSEPLTARVKIDVEQ